MADAEKTTVFSPKYRIKINKWKVREGFQVNNNQLILLYELTSDGGGDSGGGDGGGSGASASGGTTDTEIKRLKSTKCGVVKKRFFKEGDFVDAEKPLLELCDCIHATVIKDMCADCGADLRQDECNTPSEASVPMVHSVPELKVSHEVAQELGKADTIRLLKDRKLVLLVDLDQTLIHTTNDNVPKNLKGVYHFQLYGPNSPWYHTRLRPGTFQFLENIAPYFELHICTFGARNYAHTIAQFLDENGKFFSHRILSRDECFNPTYKTDNLRALFPCGDSMVCIIDDREDVWNMATNLIQVKPYHFFQHTGDINAPPTLSKHELDGKGVFFGDLKDKSDSAEKSPEKASPAAAAAPEGTDEIPSSSTEGTDNCDKNKIDVPKEKENESADLEIEQSTRLNEKRTDVDVDIETKTENKEEVEVIDSSTSAATAAEASSSTSRKQESETETEPQIEPNKTQNQKDDLANSTSKLSTNDENSATTDDTLIDIEDPDDYLLYLETILMKIHTRFYTLYDETKQMPDLKTLLPKIRSEVLLGKTLVFSGLVPTQIKLEKSKAYLIARSLGANVTQQLTDETTHLVASTAGTFKVNAARKMSKIHIVSPDWLWTCAERWECVEEQLFPVDSKKASKTRQPPAHCHSPEHVVNYAYLNESDVPSSSEQSTSNIDEVPKFIDTINPLLKFSNDDLEAMNEDVNDLIESDSSDDDDDDLNDMDLENPPLNKDLRKRKREEEDEEIKRKIFHADVGNVDEASGKCDRGDIGGGGDGDSQKSSVSSKSSRSSDDESPSSKFRRGCDLPSDLDIDGDNSADSSNNENLEDDGDWNMMGAALEREFLGLD